MSTTLQAQPDTPSSGRTPHQPVFATTHWSVVLRAADAHDPQTANALEKLCQTYWRPLFIYARRRGYSPSDAEDLTQAFFAWVLERDWLAQADQNRGRFRSFLLTSFSRFLANEWDKSQTQKRGGGLIVEMRAADKEAQDIPAAAGGASPEEEFERRWALTLLECVMFRLQTEYAQDGKADLFNDLKPCLLGERSLQPYATLAAKTGMTEGSIKVMVFRLRQRYRQLLREEIANTIESQQEIEDELRHLITVLAR